MVLLLWLTNLVFSCISLTCWIIMRTFVPDFYSWHWEGEGGFFFLKKVFCWVSHDFRETLFMVLLFRGDLKHSVLSHLKRDFLFSQTNNRRLLLVSLQYLTSSSVTKSHSVFYFLKCCSSGDKKGFILAQEANCVILILPQKCKKWM